MNSARLDKSDRLQRVLNVLRDGDELTTMEIIILANVCAVNSIIAELRDNGFPIRCRQENRRWYYKLLEVPV